MFIYLFFKFIEEKEGEKIMNITKQESVCVVVKTSDSGLTPHFYMVLAVEPQLNSRSCISSSVTVIRLV